MAPSCQEGARASASAFALSDGRTTAALELWHVVMLMEVMIDFVGIKKDDGSKSKEKHTNSDVEIG